MNCSRNPANKRVPARSVVILCLLSLAGIAVAQAPEPPPGGAALEAWLKAGHYKTWRAESAIHGSQGPHFGKVRAYLNPVLSESLTSKAQQHPKGAVAVKELYGEGEALQGWSVAIKTAAESGGGSNWYWYEIFQNKLIKDGQGVLLCRGCHFTGRDYVLTPWPLK